VKTGGRLVKHARHYWLWLAEGHLNRRRFRSDAAGARRIVEAVAAENQSKIGKRGSDVGEIASSKGNSGVEVWLRGSPTLRRPLGTGRGGKPREIDAKRGNWVYCRLFGNSKWKSFLRTPSSSNLQNFANFPKENTHRNTLFALIYS
jgi:hypothetical protein